MKAEDVTRIARMLAHIQDKLRARMLDNMLEDEEELMMLFDPESYSHALDEYREKYLDKLHLLQGIINELSIFDDTHRRRVPKVVSVSADSYDQLTKLVNGKFAELEGCRIIDVKFMQSGEEERAKNLRQTSTSSRHPKQWVAFITYIPNPLRPLANKSKSER